MGSRDDSRGEAATNVGAAIGVTSEDRGRADDSEPEMWCTPLSSSDTGDLGHLLRESEDLREVQSTRTRLALQPDASAAGTSELYTGAVFDSDDCFKRAFDQWCVDTKSRMSITTSSTTRGRWRRVYQCAYGVRNAQRKSDGSERATVRCPVEIVLWGKTKRSDGIDGTCEHRVYHVTKMIATHVGHDPVQDSTFSRKARRRICQRHINLIVELFDRKIAPIEIASRMRAITGVNVEGADVSEVYHELHTAKILHTDAAALKNCLEKMSARHELDFEIRVSQNGAMETVHFITALQKIVFASFPGILGIDATYKTNRYGLPYLVMTAVDGYGNGVPVAQTIMRAETTEDYVEALLFVKSRVGEEYFSLVQQVMCDGDPAVLHAVGQVLPHAAVRLCTWHVHQNWIKKLKRPATRISEIFWALSKSSTPEIFEAQWMRAYEIFGSGNATFLDYYYERRHLWYTTVNSLMASEASNLASVPYLERLTADTWQKFRSEFEAYRARGGMRSVKELCSGSALRLVALRLKISVDDLKDVSDSTLFAKVAELFAPRTELESYDRFKKITMHARTANLDAVLSYIQAFDKQQEQSGGVLPEQKKLRKLFLAGLRPARLAERVKFAEPASLDVAKQLAMDEVENLIRMTKEVQLSSDSTSSVPRPAPATAKGRAQADVPVAARNIPSAQPQVRCYDCNELGHRRGSPLCPAVRRGQGQWVRSQRDPRGRLVSGAASSEGAAAGTRAAVSAQSATAGSGMTGPKSPGGAAPATANHVNVVQAPETSSGGADLPVAEMPRLSVALRCSAAGGATGDVPVTALFDTGAVASFISPAVFGKLLEQGVSVRSTKSQYTAAGGVQLEVTQEVFCSVVVAPGAIVGAPLQRTLLVPAWFGVLECGEDVLLSYPLLRSSGLLDLLSQTPPDVDAKAAANAESDAEWTGDDCYDFPDGALPEVPEGSEYDCVRAVVREYADVFSALAPDGAAVDPMPILLKEGALPKPLPPRRHSPAIAQVIKDQIQEWHEAHIIRSSSSSLSAPIVVVRKKDGNYRVCVDYRDLNSCTIDMKYPIQNTRAILDRLAGKVVFGTLDLRSGFHQIPLCEEAKHLTAFAHPAGLEEFERLQFGLKNGPAYFQATMARVLNGLVENVCEVFIDDIVVYGASIPEFAEHLQRVLLRLREFRLRAKGGKCHLALPEVEFVGHTVSRTGLTVTDTKKQGVKDVKVPTTTTQLRSFIGLANYFRTFVPGFADIAAPLNRMCSKRVPFAWTSVHQSAFERLKAAIVEAPMLYHLDYSLPIIVRTDASTLGVGAVLVQRVDGVERCVCCVSKAFAGAESRWSTIEQEAFAVFFGVTSFRHYLLGHEFTVETDHRNLAWMDKSSAAKIIRWRLQLQEFNFAVRHIPGKENCVADALSRCGVVVRCVGACVCV